MNSSKPNFDKKKKNMNATYTFGVVVMLVYSSYFKTVYLMTVYVCQQDQVK